MPDDPNAPTPADATGSETAAGDTVTLSAAEFESVKREGMEWRERCARMQAEFDNARKRLRKEADEAGSRAVARFVRPILDQIDNLERALVAAKPEAFAEFSQGVALIQESLRAALAQSGLEAVPCEGVFDPAIHEVLAEEPRADLAKGTIVAVHRSGWRLKDQLVRSAQVVVARPA